MYSIIVEDHFEAAHHLVGYKGACARVHGHRWIVRACWRDSHLNSLGMVMDFKNAKEALKEAISNYDHRDLNDRILQPTAENLAKRVFDTLSVKGVGAQAGLMWVEVEESPGCVIRYEE